MAAEHTRQCKYSRSNSSPSADMQNKLQLNIVSHSNCNSIHDLYAGNEERGREHNGCSPMKIAPPPDIGNEKSLLWTRSCSSISGSGSLSRAGSIRLGTYTALEITVLFIDIKGFTAQCAAAPAGRVGEWVAAFYERVDAAAAAHGVSKVEVRGDCCVCVAGAEGAVPSRAVAAAAAADRRADQATRMLAFAAALHRDLATLPAAAAPVTATRMGVATGEAAFLVSDSGSGPDSAPFTSLLGDAAAAAARMEAMADIGELFVHRSTADRWAMEAGRAPPPSLLVEFGGGARVLAAVFDCEAGAFRSAPHLRAGSDGPARRRRNSLH